MIQTPNNKYLNTAVQTASPMALVIMLYDGAIRFCRKAIDSIEQQDYESSGVAIERAQNIVKELTVTLKPEYPISRDLRRIYEYISFLLVRANISRRTNHLEEAVEHLRELREAWVTISKQPQSQTSNG